MYQGVDSRGVQTYRGRKNFKCVLVDCRLRLAAEGRQQPSGGPILHSFHLCW